MLKHTIHNLIAREILDSRGEPTLEVKVELSGGLEAVAAVPTGASTGIHEAVELRDNEASRYGGKGVLKAVEMVNQTIAPALKGLAIMEQQQIDRRLNELDGTPDKSKLGANAMLGVSLACARSASSAWQLPLYRYLRKIFALPEEDWLMPLPMMNLINGGRHADSNLAIQEVMVVPRRLHKVKGQLTVHFAECVRIGSEVFHSLGMVLKKNNLDTDLGDEGGYGPNFTNTEQAFDLLLEAIRQAGFKAGQDVGLALDVAASEFYQEGKYKFEGASLTRDNLTSLYQNWLKKYPLIAIEDGLEQDDWPGWSELTKTLGSQILIVGDDLFVTNRQRLAQGSRLGAANAIIIKPNQIGTLTETAEMIKLARQLNYQIIVSHRSGETLDTFIADLAVAARAEYIKAGSAARGERVAKYNRLMEIESELLAAN